MKFYEKIIERLEKGEKMALATIVETKGSTPRKAGSKMLLLENGSFIGTIGGGCIEAEVYAYCKEVLKTLKSKKVKFVLSEKQAQDYGMTCGGMMEVFMEVIKPFPKVYVFGCGHIGACLYKLLKFLNYGIVMLDDRPMFADKKKFPGAEVVCRPFPDMFKKIKFADRDFAVIVTRGHQHDEFVLKNVLKNKPKGYTGMIGSKSKVANIKKKIIKSGIPEKTVKNIFSPIGLDIGAQTPEEIAVAIIAEIIKYNYNN